MAIDYDALKVRSFEDKTERYTKRDTILYALGVGLGADPTDEAQLRFVYEEGLKALPTMALVKAMAAPWIHKNDTGIQWRQMLHGEQVVELHGPLSAEGEVYGESSIEEIVDKGAGKGAIIYTKRLVRDVVTKAPIATLRAGLFCRADGGFGGPVTKGPPPHELPSSPPDAVCDLKTLAQAALIYRLSGDYNPLHASPAAAAEAGFPRPILHGLCSFAVAGHAVLRVAADYRPERIKKLQARFSAPVFPGETLRTEIWRQGGARIGFRSKVLERDIVVINNGLVELN
jgi:acyl dehydratase